MMYPYFSKAERKLLDQVNCQIFKEDSTFVYYGFCYQPYSNNRKEYVLSNGIFKTNRLDLLRTIPHYNSINYDSLVKNFVKTGHTCTRCKIACREGEYCYFEFSVLPNMFTISFKGNCKTLVSNKATNTIFTVGIDKVTLESKCISECN